MTAALTNGISLRSCLTATSPAALLTTAGKNIDNDKSRTSELTEVRDLFFALKSKGKRAKKNKVNKHTSRSTHYPCCVSALGGFIGSWLYAVHQGQS